MIDSYLKNAEQCTPRTTLEPFTPSLDHLEGGDEFKGIVSLFRTLANHSRFSSISDAMSALLAIGCKTFDLEKAALLQPISDQVFEVKASHDTEEKLFVGQHIPSACLPTFSLQQKNKIVVDPNVHGNTMNTQHIAYNLAQSRAYIGISLKMSNGMSGLVCFVSEEPGIKSFGLEEALFLELLAEGIACMTDLQTARNQRKTEDLAIFASGSLKSLEEYQVLAELPEGLGISGKVVEVLKRRIGQASLSIDSIAEELNLSKRTLQRRLQQQGISFAELRDKVRFHYSIDFLVKQQVSIDRISSTLDFSDRTSFTNAFKRWTGLSPSTFRKVFRDYV